VRVQLPIDEINNIMSSFGNWDKDGLGKTGESYIVGDDYLMRTNSRFMVEDRENYLQRELDRGLPKATVDRMKALGTTILQQNVKTPAADEALAGKTGEGIIDDYRGIEVLSAYAPLNIEGVKWAIVSEIDVTEAFSATTMLRNRVLAAAGIILLLAVVMAYLVSNTIAKPVKRVQEVIERLAKGALPKGQLAVANSKDEIGQMARSVEVMAQNLSKKVEFAQQIGEGNLKCDYELTSDEDVLGSALVNMRNNLETSSRSLRENVESLRAQEEELRQQTEELLATQEEMRRASEALQARQKELEAKQFFDSGVARFAEIMNVDMTTTTLEQWGYRICAELHHYFNAAQAALYRANDDRTRLDKLSAYSYDVNTAFKDSFALGEGLVGEAARRGEVTVLDNIQTAGARLHAGAVEFTPQTLIIIPLMANQQLEGVLEITAMQAFDDNTLQLIRTIGDDIALNLLNLRAQVQIQKLLKDAQEANAQLVANEEELRQNYEELQATQDELQRAGRELSEQLAAINRSMAMIEFELDGTILWANELFLQLTKYSLDEIVGRHHRIFAFPEDFASPAYGEMWRKLAGGEPYTAEFRRLDKNQEEFWLYGSYNPIIGVDGKPYKVIKFVVELTQQKRQQRELMDAQQIAKLGSWEYSLETHSLLWSSQLYDNLGLDHGTQITFDSFMRMIPEADARQELQKAIEVCIESGKSFFVEHPMTHASGELVYVASSGKLLNNAHGKPVRLIGTAQDVTDRVAAQRALVLREKRLQRHNKALMELNQSNLLESGDMRTTLRNIAETAQKTLEADRCSVWFFDPKNAKLACFDLFDAATQQHHQGMEVQQSERPQYFAALREQRIVLSDTVPASPLPGTQQVVLANHMDSPIRFNGRVVGVLRTEILDTDREWSLEEQNFSGAISDFITLAMEGVERKKAEQAIRKMNENLEQLVEERTRELKVAMANLQNTQDHLLQSEKMAALGQLIAGVAHEVNTPIAAIKASVRNMMRILPETMQAVPKLLSNLPPDLGELFLRLVDRATATDVMFSTRERRNHQRNLEAILNEAGLSDAPSIASNLVEIRVVEGIEEFIPLLRHPDSQTIVNLAYKLGQLKVNMDNIHNAGERTAKIVFALKSYSHVQQADQLVETNLAESLDTILTLYNNQLKHGVQLTKEFDPNLPKVPVYPDELGQVWTNIIHNGLQAMGGTGALSLRTSLTEDGKYARVDIQDNGPGIPPEIQKRIFEPFFTTKPQGQGTGLGLDITRKIIEKHQGRISVESEPGRTVFSIFLPLKHENVTAA